MFVSNTRDKEAAGMGTAELWSRKTSMNFRSGPTGTSQTAPGHGRITPVTSAVWEVTDQPAGKDQEDRWNMSQQCTLMANQGNHKLGFTRTGTRREELPVPSTRCWDPLLLSILQTPFSSQKKRM